MSKDIKEIEFVFENCEIIRFKPEELGEFHIGKIRESIDRVALNSIATSREADDIAIEIFKKAQFKPSVMDSGENKDYFKRIAAFHDITHFNLIYADDTEDYIGVVWEDSNNDEVNAYQREMYSELGNFYIIISSDKTKDFKDYFDIDEINNLDYMSFREDMVSGWDE